MHEDKHELMQSMIKDLKTHGFRVEQGTAYCDYFRASHVNCTGCESEPGCSRLCALSIIFIGSLVDAPRNVQAVVDTIKKVKQKMDKIMDKNTTLDEVRGIV